MSRPARRALRRAVASIFSEMATCPCSKMKWGTSVKIGMRILINPNGTLGPLVRTWAPEPILDGIAFVARAKRTDPPRRTRRPGRREHELPQRAARGDAAGHI